MRILIIEDEKLTANDLAKTIHQIEPDFEIVAILNSVEDSIRFLRQDDAIDLIFSDIQLGDGLSFEIFERTNCKTPIVFCTAFDEYTLDAFKAVGIDYVLKPFSKQTISKSLEKFLELKNRLSNFKRDEYSNILVALKQQLIPQKLPSIIIQKGEKIIPIEAEKIAFFHIENDCVYANTFEQKKHLISQKLDSLEQSLSPEFFRANRQFLVNRRAVKDAEHYFNRKIVINLILPNTEKIIVGKLKVTAFMDWLARS